MEASQTGLLASCGSGNGGSLAHLSFAVSLHEFAEGGVSLYFELDHRTVLPRNLQVDVVVLRLHSLLMNRAVKLVNQSLEMISERRPSMQAAVYDLRVDVSQLSSTVLKLTCVLVLCPLTYTQH